MMKKRVMNSEVTKKEVVNLTWGNQGRMLKEGNADKESWNMDSVDKGKRLIPQKKEHTQTWEGWNRLACVGNYNGAPCVKPLVEWGTRRWGVEASWPMLGSGLLSLKNKSSKALLHAPSSLTFLRTRRSHLPHFSGEKNEAPGRTAGLAPEIIWGLRAWSSKVQRPLSALTHSPRKLP